ncbi:helix-turn-helix domain-containing protein [Bifidobacterium crudilactis]|jgi:predicted transcriptional regulator|uniref:helix-turn-helix domain-containing protein n=1 Tax=Bifidobacterium crudilactis TaxID=327277 RepID=UPI00235237A0|nr:helix-turn-helix transcriptional regulator [Bifidobacterium crudilactis]MCI1868525.1 helix-turn-helix domain-containing protein [Bifidobacterium crudilactis]
MSATTKVIAETTRSLIEGEGMSQEQVGAILGRSQSYVSARVKGLQPWTTEDIDTLAKHFGFANAFGLIDKARGEERG